MIIKFKYQNIKYKINIYYYNLYNIHNNKMLINIYYNK